MTETPIPYGTSPQSDFESQYKRVFEAAECRTQSELAAVLNIKQSSVSDAKRRRAIPSDWLMTLFEKKRVNPDWVRGGLGDMLLCAANSAKGATPAIINIVERRPAQECTTDELLVELVRRALKNID